jgi:hypothetical protein
MRIDKVSLPSLVRQEVMLNVLSCGRGNPGKYGGE